MRFGFFVFQMQKFTSNKMNINTRRISYDNLNYVVSISIFA